MLRILEDIGTPLFGYRGDVRFLGSSLGTGELPNDQRVVLLADVFNLLDNQDPTAYDTWTERSFSVPNLDYGSPRQGGQLNPSFQAPRQVRVGARFEWQQPDDLGGHSRGAGEIPPPFLFDRSRERG